MEDWFLISTEVLNHYLLIMVPRLSTWALYPSIIPLFHACRLFLVSDYVPTALYVCTSTLGDEGL